MLFIYTKEIFSNLYSLIYFFIINRIQFSDMRILNRSNVMQQVRDRESLERNSYFSLFQDKTCNQLTTRQSMNSFVEHQVMYKTSWKFWQLSCERSGENEKKISNVSFSMVKCDLITTYRRTKSTAIHFYRQE